MNLIIVNLSGGLGNQMFQYAAGKALALRTGGQLRLFIESFAGYKLHNGFELHRIFDCPDPLATRADIRDVLGWRTELAYGQLLPRKPFRFFRGNRFIMEPSFRYWPGYTELTDNCFLFGYWQSPKYFSDLCGPLRRYFRFKQPLSEDNAVWIDKINNVDSVSVHIRRNDYVKNPATLAKHGICTEAYYRSSIDFVAERVAEPVFFIFSDDVRWARENIRFDFPHEFVCNNAGTASYNDMRLMSSCKHHIIANSSFSWWGAWLSHPADEKIVISPQPWFDDTLIDASDLVPQNWLRLPKNPTRSA
ncbi:alpha-1,2-fucosyltransferase [Noviherbaspirillum sp.]|uniref:alpha-1,2-fucosyltransferase n=1 Tax=Noviherbaspirillum sp. TaxID=1926288 RepID=UPI002FE070A1